MPKLNKKLTETQIRNAKPIPDKDFKLYDDGGLRLLVRKTGTKVWQYPYSIDGKSNIYTIGKYPDIGTAEAREKRDAVRKLLAQGINPNSLKSQQRRNSSGSQQNTFEAVTRSWLSQQVWAKKHARNVLLTMEKDVFPEIGSKPVNEIAPSDIVAILKTIDARDAKDVAKRVGQRCSSVFEYAMDHALCETNPALGRARIIRRRATVHRPYLKADQLPEFLNKLEHYSGGKIVQLAMKLLILTFVRPGELRNANWGEINCTTAEWHIPAERMKMKRPHIVPLSRQALEVLEELGSITGKEGLLFPGERGRKKPISDVTLIKMLQIMGYKDKEKVVPHGMRATASTILNEKPFNRDVIERQLAHVEGNKVRAAYNHSEYLTDRAVMMQWWADYLDKARNKT